MFLAFNSGNRHWMHANMPLDKLMVFRTSADGDGPSRIDPEEKKEEKKKKKRNKIAASI